LTYTAVLNGRPVPYRVVVSRRARSWRLSIHPHTGLSVVLPAQSSMRVETLLAAHAGWIHRALQRAAARPVPRRIPLEAGSLLPYLGRALRLEVDPTPDVPTRMDDRKGTLGVGATSARLRLSRIEAWYRQQAYDVFLQRLQVVNAVAGVRFGRVTVRDQRTRWGSCSTTGNLAFNWRLVMAPLAIVDSVVAHELTHLLDPSHAPSFWKRLAAIDPECDSHRRWLRRYGGWLALGCELPPAFS
jgi:predicted metal-dependent hydrolase